MDQYYRQLYMKWFSLMLVLLSNNLHSVVIVGLDWWWWWCDCHDLIIIIRVTFVCSSD
jgi:hypothetical protein